MRWSSLPSRKLHAKLFARALHLLAALRFGSGTRVCRDGRSREEQIEQALFGGLLGALGHFIELLFAHHVDRSFDEIAHHGLNIAADVTHFGVLRSFHFDEGAAGQAGEASRNFRLAHTRRPDHQNILGKDVFGELGSELLAANAIAKRDGDRFLGCVLAHDIFIELDDNFARRELVKRWKRFRLRSLRFSGQVDHHILLRFTGHSSSMLNCAFVKMQISLAMRMASWAMSFEFIFVNFSRARAAARA